MRPARRGKIRFYDALCLFAVCTLCILALWLGRDFYNQRPGRPRPLHLERPYGMAPVAFDAYICACYRAKVNPDRITQTIGDYPASRGYHLKDGVVLVRGVSYDYTAAVDLHIGGLDKPKIQRLLAALSREGFACWFRGWPDNQHIHAVYSGLPMKRQLRAQVAEFYEEHRRLGWRPVSLRVVSTSSSAHYGS